MLRFILMSLSCVTVANCNVNTELKGTENHKIPFDLPQLKLDANTYLPSSSVSENPDFVNFTETNDRRNDLSPEISTNSRYNRNGNYMILSPTEYYNSQRNPLYKLRLFVNGQEVYSFMTVSGRAHTQTKDRNRSGTEAPLPNGEYRVAKSTTRGTIAEAGDRFLPLTPKFETGRTALGIHYDPSYEKNNGEDGTSGCIGLKNRKELSQLLKYVKMYKLNTLYVEIQSRSGE